MNGRLCVKHPYRINNLQVESRHKLFLLKTLTQNRGGGGGMTTKRIRIIGGGLAGPEAALQAAKRGCQVDLYEMRPTRSTEAHHTSDFAQLVYSNSLHSAIDNYDPWIMIH